MTDEAATKGEAPEVRHVKDGDHRGAFVVMGERERLAEMTYTMAGTDLVIIDHTWVDDSLRGGGVGRHLLDALVAWVREAGHRVMPLCPYAKSVFEKDPSIRDVLSK